MRLSRFLTINNKRTVKFSNVSTTIPLNDFPCIYCQYHARVGKPGYKTCEVEKCGDNLRQSSKVTSLQSKKFIKLVCLWGLGKWLGGIFEKKICSSKNKPCPIDALKLAIKSMNAQGDVIPSNTRQNFTSIIKNATDILLCPPLSHVGLSMASKFLRMLYPEYCVAYDEKHLQSKLPYSPDSKGYAEFCADCFVIAKELDKISTNPKCRKWYAADVEAVIFETI